MRIVLTDTSRTLVEMDISETTIEMAIPLGCSFTALGELPTHVHDGPDGNQVAVFVRRDECRRCR
jgi:hypothetical protein